MTAAKPDSDKEAAMRLPHRVIDADGHIDEKHVDWAARVPERFRADAPGGGVRRGAGMFRKHCGLGEIEI